MAIIAIQKTNSRHSINHYNSCPGALPTPERFVFEITFAFVSFSCMRQFISVPLQFIASGRGRDVRQRYRLPPECINKTCGCFAFSVDDISPGNIWPIHQNSFYPRGNLLLDDKSWKLRMENRL